MTQSTFAVLFNPTAPLDIQRKYLPPETDFAVLMVDGCTFDEAEIATIVEKLVRLLVESTRPSSSTTSNPGPTP